MHETLKLCLVMLIPKFEGVLGFMDVKRISGEPLVRFKCITTHFNQNDYIIGGAKLIYVH